MGSNSLVSITLGKTLWGAYLWKTNRLGNQPSGKLSLLGSNLLGNQSVWGKASLSKPLGNQPYKEPTLWETVPPRK